MRVFLARCPHHETNCLQTPKVPFMDDTFRSTLHRLTAFRQQQKWLLSCLHPNHGRGVQVNRRLPAREVEVAATGHGPYRSPPDQQTAVKRLV